MSALGTTDFSAVKLALMAQEMRAQTVQLLRAEPVAIVGMACRTPGGCDTPDAFWQLLLNGVDATSDIPSDRFNSAAWRDPDPSAPGKMQATRGGFLARIDSFDADYFGILPREAEQMDPQQRIAIETAIDAIDDAGVVASTMRGSRAGVFMASYHNDYARLVFDNPKQFDIRTLTGSLHGVVANRISHFLDWRGPSLTLDTGCSSSLVAVHLACQSLRLGEIDFALAGGVSAIIAPELFVAMTKVGFMAPDGRCKTFDARADGFGRGEGCGVVALKRLSDAIVDGDRIHAVIRGSAVNQDGRSTVLTAPNGQAQKAMIREALDGAAVAPERISFVEAHGTGTALGDPIELEAIAETLGRAPGGPCFVGSAKANIGHLEAAAGVIGLIKAVLVLRHRLAPPQPGFGTLSPHISLDGTRLQVPTAPTPLGEGHVNCASVSSFGIGGTNAHVVIEEAPGLPAREAPDKFVWTLPLSAKTSEGLMSLGRDWLDLLADAQTPPIEDLCFTASRRRTHHPLRIAVTAKSKAGLRERLAVALETPPSQPQVSPQIGFVFSGQGPQWWAMGRELHLAEPVFRASMQACSAAIEAVAGWSVIDELARSEEHTRIGQTAFAQPALFALQTSLAALWNSWGIRPAALVGHSVGEIAALHAAGILSLPEAARIVVKRGLAMDAATGRGRMAAVSLSQAEAQAIAARSGGGLDVAAVNSPRSAVLSGTRDALEAALTELRDRGVEARDLQIDYAFHSAGMTAIANEFAHDLGQVIRSAASIPVFSTLTGAALTGDEVDETYLARAIRAPVRFADAISAMTAAGANAFVEIGPHPVLASAIAETLEASPPRAIVHSLRRGRDECETMRTSLTALYGVGADPDWECVQPEGGSVTSLPSYPWRRKRYWISNDDSAATTPWLGTPVDVAGMDRIVVPVHPRAIGGWVSDHRIFGETIVPGTAIMQMLAAAGSAIARTAVAIEDFVIHAALSFGSEDDRWQVVGTPQGQDFALCLFAEVDSQWKCMAEARTAALRTTKPIPASAGGAATDQSGFYARLGDLGIEFGPAYRSLTYAWRNGDEAGGRAVLSSALPAEPAPHPALLDAGLQLALLATGMDGAFVPVGADRITLDIVPERSVQLQAVITSRSETTFSADVFVKSDIGRVVAALEGVRFVNADASQFGADGTADNFYSVEWLALAAGETTPLEKAWIVLEDKGGVGAAFAVAIAAAGGRALRIASGAPTHVPSEMADAALACFWPLDEAATYGDLLALIRAYANAGPRLVVLVVSGTSNEPTRLGQPGRRRAVGFAAVARVAALEHPDLRLRVVDIDPLASLEQRVTALLAAIQSSTEPYVAARAAEVRAPRLTRRTHEKAGPQRVVQAGNGLDGVALQPLTLLPPGRGELQVRVRAAGVNFRDTLVALDAYPGAPVAFGAECAGFVEAVGSGVTEFAAGDRVVGLALGAMASHATMRADLAMRLPDGLRFDIGAALPVASVTAHIALRHFANLKAGERVLIHAASGGVGLAAIALTRRAGAEIFATAGSHEKRDFLVKMGAARVFDSRTLDFAEEILSATRGEGVHVALNALSGRFVDATLKTIAPNGMLLELGKRQVRTAAEVAAVRPDVRYHVFDAGVMAEAEPALFKAAMRDVLQSLTRGDMSCPPVETYPIRQAPAALRRMASARHIGKLVLTVGPVRNEVVPVRADGEYLITGGYGGIGLEAAAWLVRRGARRITLVGRSQPGNRAIEAIAELEEAGARVRRLQFDLADAAALQALMKEIGTSLRGIFHAAGIPANGLVSNLDSGALDAARRGKVEGAHELRRETRGAPLDFVVLCSSAAALFGGQGQGAYTAANAELEALAQEWRGDGVNVVSVAWGPWSESGMFVESAAATQAAWRSRGLLPMRAARAFATLDRLLANEKGHAVIADIDWQQALAEQNTAFIRPLLGETVRRVQPVPAVEKAALKLADLRSLPLVLVRAELVKLLTRQVRTLLELADDAVVSPTTALKDVGLDSLLAVELRNQLARVGGVPLPATLAFDHPTVDALADRLSIVWQLVTDRPPAAKAADHSTVDDMGDDEAAALLETELRMLSVGRPA